jgi:TRAP-type C4-dicarboxylate transport system substrate-binding protein
MKSPAHAAIRVLCTALSAVALSGCSIFMAANQPDKKDLSVLTAGTPRARLLEEFGQPISSRLQGDKRIDLFTFVQGYRKEVKAVRALGHGVGDIATVGLWEFAGTSAETVLDGKKLSFEVTYNRADCVERVVRLAD